MISIYALTWLVVIATQSTPGPNLAAVASVGLAQGRRPALFTVTGICSGMIFWSVASTCGLSAIIEVVPYSLFALKFVGGLYLLFLGYKAAQRALRGGAATRFEANAPSLSDAQAWQRGLLVLLTNPKAALMWITVASFLFGQGFSAWQVLVVGPMGALSGSVIYGTYAWLFSTGVAMRGYSQYASGFESVFAVAFGFMGGGLLWTIVSAAQN